MAKSGRKRFGFYQDEAAVVEVIRLKRRRRKAAAGETAYRQIARELNAEGFTTQTGKQFGGQTVKDILSPAAEPVKKKKYAKAEQPQKYWTAEEVGRIFEACRTDRERAVIEILVGTGLRRGEFVELRISDVQFKGAGGLIDVRRGKGFKRRGVVISPELAGFIHNYIKTYRSAATPGSALFERMNGVNLYYLTTKLGRRAGLAETANPHSFRHTFATVLYNYTKDITFVQQQLGHSSMETTAIYTKCLSDNKLEAMSILNAQLHLGGQFNKVHKFTRKEAKKT